MTYTWTDDVMRSGNPCNVDLVNDNLMHLKYDNNNIPVGTIVYVASSTASNGTLKCNGAAVSRTTYSNLFNSIGTTFGIGDGSTTFNLPDLRGEFIRGYDDGRGVDSGRILGSGQSDNLKSHKHLNAFNRYTSGNGSLVATTANGTITPFTGTAPNNGSTGVSIDRVYDDPAGGAETRPRNIALLAVIKY